MARKTAFRQMRLTERHLEPLRVAMVDPGPQLIDGHRSAEAADYDAMVEDMLAGWRQGEGFWLFGYGSLIWKPETAFTETRAALARGWHRRFCLGWDYRFRGSRETPGLMLALDRGGQCEGVVYRLPDEGLRAELDKLVRREMSMVPTAFPPRWITAQTTDGPVRSVAFAMNRRSPRYITGLSDEEVADVLATAHGFRGSMAEYLLSTVSHLENQGIHDGRLWVLQELVAERIERAHPMALAGDGA